MALSGDDTAPRTRDSFTTGGGLRSLPPCRTGEQRARGGITRSPAVRISRRDGGWSHLRQVSRSRVPGQAWSKVERALDAPVSGGTACAVERSRLTSRDAGARRDWGWAFHQAMRYAAGLASPDRAASVLRPRSCQAHRFADRRRALGVSHANTSRRAVCRSSSRSALNLQETASLPVRTRVIRKLSYNARMSPVSIRRVPAEGKPLTVRLDANLDRRMQAAASREGVSVSDFVRQAITERLDRGVAESTLWDRIAPTVVRRGRRSAASTSQDTGTLGWLAEPERPGRTSRGHLRKSKDDTHAEFAAGLEAEAADKWHRTEE
jgi:hypothetical protein